MSFQDICQDFELLVDHIRDILPFVTIVVSSIIPRLGDWEWSKGWVIKMNDYMQVWCCEQQQQGRSAIFVPAYKFFLKEGRPMPIYYAWDGIHLSDMGLRRIKQALQQALGQSNLAVGGRWKRMPQGWGKPTLRRKRKVVGNNIVF